MRHLEPSWCSTWSLAGAVYLDAGQRDALLRGDHEDLVQQVAALGRDLRVARVRVLACTPQAEQALGRLINLNVDLKEP